MENRRAQTRHAEFEKAQSAEKYVRKRDKPKRGAARERNFQPAEVERKEKAFEESAAVARPEANRRKRQRDAVEHDGDRQFRRRKKAV